MDLCRLGGRGGGMGGAQTSMCVKVNILLRALLKFVWLYYNI